MSKALAKAKPLTEWDRMLPMWLHGRPESTRYIYEPVIKEFRRSVEQKPISQITLEDLQLFYDECLEQRQKIRTTKRKLSTVKSLLSFCHRCGMIPFNVGAALRLPKVPEDLAQKILTPEQIHRMIDHEDSTRNQVLLRVLYGAGIRASEASGLRWCDLQPRDNDGQITVLGKGQKSRTIRISARTWAALQSIRPADVLPETPVFVTSQGKAMGRRYISIVVSRAARNAGIPAAVSAHWMRHGHATHAVDRGAPLRLVQETLGHSDLTTTGRYIHVRPGESSSRYMDV
jgi:site-specific recombinase XerD